MKPILGSKTDHPGRLSQGRGWLFLLLAISASGCLSYHRGHHGSFRTSVASTPDAHWPNEHKLEFHYQIRDNLASLDCDRMTLIFHGLSQAQRRMFHFPGTGQSVQIGGNGASTMSVSGSTDQGAVAFHSHYEDGTNTLQFERYTARLAEEGWLFLVGDQAWDLRPGKKVFHFKPHGVNVE